MLSAALYKGANEVDYLVFGAAFAGLKLSQCSCGRAVVVLEVCVDGCLGVDAIVHN